MPEDRENSIIIEEPASDNRNVNIESIARNVIGMPPERAEAVIIQTNNQDRMPAMYRNIIHEEAGVDDSIIPPSNGSCYGIS